MPLVDLKTNLKSLKYGNDRLGNGSSREPFITEPIPEGDTPGASTDFLLRQGAIKNSGQDVSRLTQLLFSTTRGFLFTTGNNLLSRTSVKTEATLGPAYAGGTINQGVYLPTSTLAQAAAGFSGTHLNLLGLDPTSPMAGVVEGGLFPGGGLIRYEQAAFDFNKNNLNRLVKLKEDKIDLDPNATELLSYGGGPGSVLGVGQTRIKRVSNTTGINPYGNPEGGFKLLSQTRVNNSLTYFNNNFPLSSISEITYGAGSPNILVISSSVPSSIEDSKVKVANAKTTFNQNNPSGSLDTITYGVASNNKTVTLDTAYLGPTTSGSYYTSNNSRTYNPNPDFQRNRYGNPGLAIGKKQYTYTGDKFNATNTEKLNTSTVNEKPDNDQLFKFYLNLVDPQSPGAKNYLYWQAYVDNFNDQVGANYDEFTYTGRGYPSFRYKGFTRAINLDFTIVATSPDQIVPIYKKLNTLIQNLAPNYSSTGYIRGNFVKLTFGDYLTNVPGIIKGFSINPIFDAGFDIGGTEEEKLKNITSGKQLPKALKISGFNFVPITSNDNKLVSSDSQFFGGKDNLLS